MALRRSGRIGILLGSIAFMPLVHAVPHGHWLAYPLVLLSTLVHELGHGLGALLVGGSFERFVMYADGSGLAVTRVDGRMGAAFVAAAGLVAPAVAASVGFSVSRTPTGARVTLGALAVLLTLAVALVVRNLFGIVFVLVTAAMAGFLAWKARPRVAELALAFTSVQLAMTVFSRADYLFTKEAVTGAGTAPSDVALMADALLLPYWFWGVVCGAISLAVLALGVKGSLARGS